MLEVKNLSVNYGAIRALHDVSLEINPGEIVSIIGSNGAGKSTLLRTISGLLKPENGYIKLEDEDITGVSPHRIAKMGISHVPEGRGIFYNLTVIENLQLAISGRSEKSNLKEDIDKVFKLFPRLAERKKQMAGTLSGGEQQMLAMGRGLIMKGKVMLLDEPSMGLAPNLVDMIFETITRLNQDGATILLVEQNAHKAVNVANRVYALKTGSIAFSGSPDHEDIDDILHSAYLA
ncbi:ATP-binding cassette domain-containing protein [Candidatus Poribacteria bacterium]|nr:ATP-binding cassette domain-containing protein [Candidatus Poribacteria bacterium]